MDRETRKANLKKLQLPGSSGNKQQQQRKTRQTDMSIAPTDTAITKYFLTPKKRDKSSEDLTNCVDTLAEPAQVKETRSPSGNDNTAPRSRAKRTKLDTFIFKDPTNIPATIKKAKKSSNDEDLIVLERKIKKAPKLSQTKPSKSRKAKKQTVIKTAFLRNEQLFAEITAQHCAADQFDGDDVQLALALSKSEVENKGIEMVDDNMKDVINGEGNMGDDVETIREKLKKYGFRTAEKKDYNTFAAAFLPKTNIRSRLKSKWANKFTALTLRSSDNQLKKIQQNIERLLNSQFRTKSLMETEQVLPFYKFQSSLLKKSGVHEDKQILRNLVNVNQPNDLFFVTELFEINQVPAGHLLKDWRAIQGRDLTPNPKDKQSIERVKILNNIYQDLEEYFSSRKRLDWTLEDQKMVTSGKDSEVKESTAKENTYSSSSEIVKDVGNEELNGMIELIEHIQRNEECVNENKELNSMIELRENIQRNNECANESNVITTSFYDKKIFQLLPTHKSLDTMHVSSCSINTQATINSTQKNRSNSPDLFADSDVELEEIDNTKETLTNVKESRERQRSSDDLKTDITTYEVFSSDEVKKTSLLGLNKGDDKEPLQKRSPTSQAADVIDLTQEDSQFNNITIDYLNQSKPIVEVDLFAESPLQDENSDSVDVSSNFQPIKCIQTDKKEEFKFALSLEASDKEQNNLENKSEDSFELSPNTKQNLKQLEEEHKSKESDDDEDSLREIVMEQTNISFLNFEGIKQLQSSFHKNTATTESDIINYNLSGNDTIFQQLCNKYLNHEADNGSTAKGQKKTDLSKHSLPIMQIPKTPVQSNNFPNISMDFDVADDDIGWPGKGESLPFIAKTPTKLSGKESKENLTTKSQSFNSLSSNISIDLTQNDDDDEDDAPIIEDDCLVLSDDEINYSIWQADKTLNLPTSQEKACQANNTSLTSNISSSDDDYKTFHKENVIEFPFNKENEKEFSYLDSEEKEKSLIKITLGPEEAISDFEILTSKYAPSNCASGEEIKFDRSEFGILEEYSEPIDGYTPNLYTPTKVLTEASFLSSPTETAAPMKRYSQRNSKKFHDLLMEVPAKSPSRNFPEFEDFDMMMSTSPLKSTNSAKKPQGIDQLLKAEISFKESQKMTPAATENLPSQTQEVKYNNKTYTVRYTNSPKPDYTTYTEAELLKQLYNYGIKPLKRKQAVKMLEYIYNQTHPILMEDEEEDIGLGDKYQEDVISLDDFELPGTSKEALKSNKFDEINFTMFSNESEKEMAAVKLPQISSKTLDLHDSCGLEILRYSSDLKAELQDEIYIFQTNVTKKTPQPLLPFHIAWYNLVCSNIKLHETILMYEPIDLQEIYLFLKSLGYRYDPKDLKTFFDRRCIIFRYDIAGAAAGGNSKLKNSNRHVRKSKKSKTSIMKN